MTSFIPFVGDQKSGSYNRAKDTLWNNLRVTQDRKSATF